MTSWLQSFSCSLTLECAHFSIVHSSYRLVFHMSWMVSLSRQLVNQLCSPRCCSTLLRRTNCDSLSSLSSSSSWLWKMQKLFGKKKSSKNREKICRILNSRKREKERQEERERNDESNAKSVNIFHWKKNYAKYKEKPKYVMYIKWLLSQWIRMLLFFIEIFHPRSF